MPERSFSPTNSPSVRIVRLFGRVELMQSTTEMTTTEVLIESSEQQRRRLRRACWIGFCLSFLAFVVVIGQPLVIRWRLQQHGWNFDSTARRMLPDWIPVWLDPWFGRFESARLDRAPLRIGDLEALRQIAPQLAWIEVVGTDVSEPGVAALSQFPELTRLEFYIVRLDSAGLHHLATTPKLEVLIFNQTQLDQDAMQEISTCHGVTRLTLTGITDQDVRHLSSLVRLQSLELIESRITNDGVKELVDGCPNLESLNVYSAPITDTGLGDLIRLKKLRSMILDDIPITDEGIQQLGGCPALDYLLLQRTKVKASGVSELQTSHPRIKASVN